MAQSSSAKSKKRTILRVKRKYSDLQATETIVLSRPAAKRRKIVPFKDLIKSFDDDLSLQQDNSTDRKSITSKKPKPIPKFFDLDRGSGPQRKAQIFRLIPKDSVPRSFQSTNFKDRNAIYRKSKMMEQRLSNRQQNIIKRNAKRFQMDSNASKRGILQHEDLEGDELSNNMSWSKMSEQKERPQHRQMALDKLKSKLLEKQKSSRTIKMITKSELKRRQNAICSKPTASNATKSAFSSDWNQRALDTANGDTENTGTQSVDSADTEFIDVQYDENQKKYVAAKHNVQRTNGRMDVVYDHYELDENADAEAVMAAIQTLQTQREPTYNKREKSPDNLGQSVIGDRDRDEVQRETADSNNLEHKLQGIKRKHLNKHFAKCYEAEQFGFCHSSTEALQARIIELERDEFADYTGFGGNGQSDDSSECQDYHEEQWRKEEDLEPEMEEHADNEYPDAMEKTDDEDEVYYDLGADYNPNYHDLNSNAVDKYDDNAFGLDFFDEIARSQY